MGTSDGLGGEERSVALLSVWVLRASHDRLPGEAFRPAETVKGSLTYADRVKLINLVER
jgi:hypothetical protein